ncbi:MAG: hypothetical protein AUK47_28985 [Deltaproteobacteria bacterium CG2_30_63_29]|nr:MAG: hypothetical protein AUK47_28985 [Deltaproteobacteria bacterium CG2_30_63_29]PIW00430.1 MAG: hypothetical protein COW42_07795 [Deltaproteobacteria bacterium CG17_big_fil_post_rev_8_21_14_2_50_63_7]PJB42132.1 MAG: hypothetical protein CO108_12160 [Deltaproteobacteria bacterium CG_4_9_14_3_um_filter_63_12]
MKTILVLDDDEDLRILLKAALEEHPLTVLEASTIQRADALLLEHPIALIVVDGQLPDGSGLDFLKRVREHDPAVLTVFMSRFYRDLKTFGHLTGELDVSLVLYKPIEVAGFADRVAELLGLEPREAASDVNYELSLSEQFAELGRQFGSRLPDRLAELTRAVAAAKDDSSLLSEAMVLAHRLRGSAGSYGYAPVGLAVGLVEELFDRARAHVAAGQRVFWEEIEAAIHQTYLAIAYDSSASSGFSTIGSARLALLVVDDDVDFLRFVRNTARTVFTEVVTARSSDEALQRTNERAFVAAILDVQLDHEDDAFQLARNIRRTAKNEDISIAFVSVDRRIQTRVAAIEAGGSRFLEKPLSKESLTEALQKFATQAQAQKGRVLIVDDDQDTREQYAWVLRSAGYLVNQLSSADLLIEALETTTPDVVLLDINLPRVSGIDVCRALRMSDRWEMLPILLVTAQTDANTRLRAFRSGAFDVIPKPVLAEELLARVGVQNDRVRLVKERSDKDGLSGLLTRRAFLESVQRDLARCQRESLPLSFALLDIDRFKDVNDSHGHLAGDRVIARLGELLRRRFRLDDLRARWGGEEFILAFSGQDAEFAKEATSRLLQEFSAQQFEADDGAKFEVSFTAGIAAFPDDGTTILSLIRSADERLYLGKEAGRARVVATNRAMGTPTLDIPRDEKEAPG